MAKKTGEGVNRDELQGNLKDPSGLPPGAGDRRSGNDQKMPKGAEGREGGSAGSRSGDFQAEPPAGEQAGKK